MSALIEIVPSMVREVIDTNLDDNQINGLISTASKAIDTKVLPEADRQGIVIDTELQVEITRWLAAHFVSIRDSGTKVASEKIGDAQITYDNDSSVSGSRWLSMAHSLDPTKALMGMSGKKMRFACF